MTQIISQTPLYAWVLLVYLAWGGWKSRRTNIISWKLLLIMPAIMFIWSIYSMVTRYGSLFIWLWAMSLSLGLWLGSLTVRKVKLQFDKQQNLIEIAGSWTPMILSITIFSLRYALGVINGLHLNLGENYLLLILENAATVVSGMFIGRLLGYQQRFKISPHIDLSGTK